MQAPQNKKRVKSDKILINFFLDQIMVFSPPPQRIHDSIFLFYFWPKCEILPTKKPCFTLLKFCTSSKVYTLSVYAAHFYSQWRCSKVHWTIVGLMHICIQVEQLQRWFLNLLCCISSLWSWNQIEDQVHFMFKFETYRMTRGFSTSSSMVHLGLSH